MKALAKALKFDFLLAAVAAWLLLCGLVFGGGPSLIEAPPQVAPYKLIDAKISGDWESAIWSVEPEASVDQRVSGDGKMLTFVAPPGCYTVRCVAVNFTDKKLSQAKTVVVIGEGVTPPVPPVPPVPTPDKPVALYLIYESKDLTPATTAVRDALPWKAAADKAGIRWLCFDQDEGAKKFPEATKRAKAVGLPAVVLLDAKGVPDVAKAPATPAAMEALVASKVAAKREGGK